MERALHHDVDLTPAKGGGGRRVRQEPLGCLTAALGAGQAVLPREEYWFETPLEFRDDAALSMPQQGQEQPRKCPQKC